MALLAFAPCLLATEYSALPFSARVIDQETGQPIEGAVALALWQLDYYTGHGGAGFLNATEAVTGTDGIFHMSGWGPLAVPRSETGAPIVMQTGEPGLYVFKAGYRIYAGNGLQDHSYFGNPLWTGDPVRAVWADSKTISLTRAPDDEKYARIFDAQTGIPLTYKCFWAKNPRMTAALVKESNRLQAAFPGIQYRLGWAHFENAPAGACGNPRDILGPYLK